MCVEKNLALWHRAHRRTRECRAFQELTERNLQPKCCDGFSASNKREKNLTKKPPRRQRAIPLDTRHNGLREWNYSAQGYDFGPAISIRPTSGLSAQVYPQQLKRPVNQNYKSTTITGTGRHFIMGPSRHGSSAFAEPVTLL